MHINMLTCRGLHYMIVVCYCYLSTSCRAKSLLTVSFLIHKRQQLESITPSPEFMPLSNSTASNRVDVSLRSSRAGKHEGTSEPVIMNHLGVNTDSALVNLEKIDGNNSTKIRKLPSPFAGGHISERINHTKYKTGESFPTKQYSDMLKIVNFKTNAERYIKSEFISNFWARLTEHSRLAENLRDRNSTILSETKGCKMRPPFRCRAGRYHEYDGTSQSRQPRQKRHTQNLRSTGVQSQRENSDELHGLLSRPIKTGAGDGEILQNNQQNKNRLRQRKRERLRHDRSRSSKPRSSRNSNVQNDGGLTEEKRSKTSQIKLADNVDAVRRSFTKNRNTDDKYGKFMKNDLINPPDDKFYEPAGCPLAKDGLRQYRCPAPDGRGEWTCIDDHNLCNQIKDCPNGEDEDKTACMFHSMTMNYFQVIMDAFIAKLSNH